MNQTLIDQIDAILPQTQCGKCGFRGCKPYATAIVHGHADINQCPPGDQTGVQKIAQLLGIAEKPLNTSHGLPSPVPMVAWIDEHLCIGCTFCIRACPVDAIAGAAKQLHTVIADECTGCELCIVPCPMDCISLIPAKKRTDEAFKKQMADTARTRFQFRQQRLAEKKQVNTKTTPAIINSQPDSVTRATDGRKQAIVSTALKRAAALRTQHKREVPT
jgi:electron transport complex protein RnfB